MGISNVKDRKDVRVLESEGGVVELSAPPDAKNSSDSLHFELADVGLLESGIELEKVKGDVQPKELLSDRLSFDAKRSTGSIKLHLKNATRQLRRKRYQQAFESSKAGIDSFRRLNSEARSQNKLLIVSLLMIRAECFLEDEQSDGARRCLMLALSQSV